MRYVYPDFKALRFSYKGGGINCFWKDLFGFSIRKTGLSTVSFSWRRFAIFWEGFFEGMKHLIVG